MDTLTERLERLAELQKKNIEPLQTLGSSALVAFERLARKNYELMGDMVDYAVAQSRGSVVQGTPQEHYERQMAEARAFAERMGERAAEYLALAEQLREELVPDDRGHFGVPGSGPSAPPMRTETPAPRTAKKASAKKAPSSAKKGSAKKRAAVRAATGVDSDGMAELAAAEKKAKKRAGSKKAAGSKKTSGRSTAAGKSASAK